METDREFREMDDAAFATLHGGRELLPIEQAVYEAEGAERFARFHSHGRTLPAQVENWIEVRAAATIGKQGE